MRNIRSFKLFNDYSKKMIYALLKLNILDLSHGRIHPFTTM